MECKIGDKVHARDEFGAGGEFTGVLVALHPVFNDDGGFLGNKATVLDIAFPDRPQLKTAVSWQKMD